MPSYSVKCHFACPCSKARTHAYLYEERITLWVADDIDAAIGMAEKEAAVYAEANQFTFLELSQAFWMFEDLKGDGTELYSLLRESDLPSKAYLDAFHNTGGERQTSA